MLRKKDGVVFTCRHVLDENKPVLYIEHDCDGDWQLLCAGVHTTDDGRIISFAEAAEIEPYIRALARLKRGQIAERESINDEWRVIG